MNHQTWSKTRFWLVMALVFVTGTLVGPAEPTQRGAEGGDNPALRQLDAIDQKIFRASLEVIDAQSQALDVSGALLGQYPVMSTTDLAAGTRIVEEQGERIQMANQQLEALQEERRSLLTD